MRDLLSSLISRNQKPHAQIRPRLGSMFELSPRPGLTSSELPELVGSELMRNNHATETQRQSSAAPSLRSYSATQETPLGANPLPGSLQSFTFGPEAGQPDVVAELRTPVGEISGDRADPARLAQLAVRPERPTDSPLSAATPSTIQPTAPPTNAPIGPQAGAQRVKATKELRPTQETDPPVASQTPKVAQTHADYPPKRTIENRRAKNNSPVAQPFTRETVRKADIRQQTEHPPEESTPIRPKPSIPFENEPPFQPQSRNVAPEVAGRTQARAPMPPTIRVTIGRIEVRAQGQEKSRPRPASPQPERRGPGLSLADYLKQRGGSP